MAYRLQAQAQQQKGNGPAAAELIDKAIEITQRLKERNALRDSEKDLLAELEKEKAAYRK